jgi:DNA-binding CsgD family transcriptional regulator
VNDSGSSRALADLVARIGDAAFADQLMLALHHLCAADMCSGFVISGGKARALFAVSMDPKRSAFARIATLRYARKYWKHDTAAAATLGRAHRSAQTTRRPSSVIRDLDYRLECYAEGDVIERISVCKAGDIQIIANAYRQRVSGPFSQQHIEQFEAASPIVIAAIDKHLRLTRLSRGVAAMPGADAIATRLRGIESAGLSLREAQVLARIVLGADQNTIAREVGVKISSVVTYRRRGYAKLGIRNKSELRSCLTGPAQPPLGSPRDTSDDWIGH